MKFTAIAALLALAGCSQGPTPYQQQLDGIVERHAHRAEAVRADAPRYRDLCRAQMPQATDDTVQFCAAQAMRRDIRDIRAEGERELDAAAADRRAGRPTMPTPIRIVP